VDGADELLAIRSVGEAEAEILTDIHAQCFPRYLNRQAFTDFFSVKNTFALLVENGQKPVAMIVYRVALEYADIITIGVLPENRRQGIARMLLEKILADCRQMGVQKIFLEVEEGNSAGLSLYEQSGFKHISRRKLYYRQLDGSLTDALVMEKRLG
jgi:ribosomal-protein-alanine N-acetyltransferase